LGQLQRNGSTDACACASDEGMAVAQHGLLPLGAASSPRLEIIGVTSP
jgi:hypothetical protein